MSVLINVNRATLFDVRQDRAFRSRFCAWAFVQVSFYLQVLKLEIGNINPPLFVSYYQSKIALGVKPL